MLIPPNISPLTPPILLVKNLPAIITPKFLENKIIPLRVALVWPESDELSEKASFESRKILSAANIIERYIEDSVNILLFFSFLKADARLLLGTKKTAKYLHYLRYI